MTLKENYEAHLSAIVSPILDYEIDSLDNEDHKEIWSNLYGGPIGVAVLLSGISKVYNIEKAQEKSNQIIERVEKYYKENIDSCRIGLSQGIAAGIYGSIKVGGNLNREASIEFASDLALQSIKNINKRDQDLDLDLLNGLPGYLIAISQLNTHIRNQKLEELIQELIETIATKVQLLESGNENFLTGLSHGLAGIVLAMSRLYKYTKIEATLEIARLALKIENRHIAEENQMWLDYRHTPPVISNAWCHGATGIGLSRIELLSIDPSNEIAHDDLMKAIAYTLSNLTTSVDHVCCGNFGRIELFLSTATLYDQKDFFKFSENIVAKLWEESKVKGGFTRGDGGFINDIGLFQGFSGIALQTLRVLHPKKIANFLIFE